MSAAFPSSVREFRKHERKFTNWLLAHGSEIRVPSNAYEVIRFVTPEGVGVVYRNRAHMLTAWENGAGEAWKAFIGGDDAWRLAPKRPRKTLTHQHATIIKRDGDGCWFCGEAFAYGGDGKLAHTVEHLVSRVHKGPDHLSNLVMAHVKCNAAAGNMSVAEKVRLRETMRAAKAAAA